MKKMWESLFSSKLNLILITVINGAVEKREKSLNKKINKYQVTWDFYFIKRL